MSVIADRTPTFAIENADYYEARPEGFDIYSWSPEPPGVENAKVTQVHMHMPVAGLGRILVHFKGPGTLDRLIAALQEHREYVWGKP